MRGRTRLAWCALWATLVTALRRPIRGPLRPSWSFSFEVTVGALRRFLTQLVGREAGELRSAFEDISAPALRGVRREAVTLGGVPCEWFTPPGASAGGRTLLFFHGGAYVWGSAHTHAQLISRIAVSARCRVLAPNYRLAPEHPWPAAHDDASAVYRALLAEPDTPAHEVVVAGDSAGGNLTLSLALRLGREGLPAPRALVLICPWVDLARRGGSVETHAAFDWIDSPGIRAWVDLYYPGRPLTDAACSPLFGELRGLPRTLVQVGGAEVLFDQGVELGHALSGAGVESTLTVYPDMVHDWHIVSARETATSSAITEIGRFVRA